MLEKALEEAIYYAKTHLGLKEEDDTYFRNLLLAHFLIEKPYEGEIDKEGIKALTLPDQVVSSLKEEMIQKGMPEDVADRQATYVMGVLSPIPSLVNETFHSLREKDPKKATDYLLSLSIANDYVAKSRIDRNLVWNASYAKGSPLEISINLSKPEKNNKDIAKLKTMKSTGYPKCLLCKENLGFAGNPKHPARENIRVIPIELDGRRWYLQYSPYGYYDEHCIVFLDEHIPMEINEGNMNALFDFVDLFPHYFIGSNSDLPIVGGSILDHEHFQGGKHLLPLLIAKEKEVVFDKGGVKLVVLDFYNNALRIHSKNKKKALDLASKILDAWKEHNDPENSIYAFTNGERHNTVTPYCRKVGDEYQMTLILRNNRCDDTYPEGIFHAHPEYHHIKKEGIGLIEAAGLFILPARLKRQIKEVEEAVEHNWSEEETLATYPDLDVFAPMIKALKERKISAQTYINEVCQGILKNVAVYKDDEKGERGLKRFLDKCL